MKKSNPINRRKFVQLSSAAASMSLLASPLAGIASHLTLNSRVTVQEVMNLFIKQVPGGVINPTVDTLKSGSPSLVVTGIVTCMFANLSVIQKAIELGANFIIAHEPTFYNHQDATPWLANDEVYQYKSALLKKHQIAVWRNHDYIHRIKPDPVCTAVAESLGWQDEASTIDYLYELKNSQTLTEIISHLKTKLGINTLRYQGDLHQPCSKILLMPGAAGGQRQIGAIASFKPELLITGEIAEWETAEYIRDARAMGKSVSLIVLGHIASEEMGSQFMAKWLKEKFPNIGTTFLKNEPSLLTI